MDYAIATLLALQATLVVLDLWDFRVRCRAGTLGADGPPSWRAAGFLVGVILVYLALQSLGGWLTPGPESVFSAVGEAFAGSSQVATESPRGLAAVLLAIVSFYLAGLWDYLIHRFFSHHRWFWITHEYHHVPRLVSVFMPGILARPFAWIPNFLIVFGTAGTVYSLGRLVGWPVWDSRALLPSLLVIVLVLTASHSSCLRRWPLVHRVMRLAWLTTPQEHVLHHAMHLQGNYGNFTTLWDRLGGTYLDPTAIDLEQLPLGLAYDQDFLGALTAGYWKLPDGLRKQWEVGRFCRLAPLGEDTADITAEDSLPGRSVLADPAAGPQETSR